MSKPIGILGGTFDPIHLGHLHLASKIYQQLDLQEIKFIPCYQSPFKDQPVANAKQRLTMLELAIKNYPEFAIDDRELQRQGISYTLDTLKSLRQDLGKIPLCWIMSMDAFVQFDAWHEWQEIIQLAHLIVADRPNSKLVANNAITELLQQRQIFAANKLTTKPASLILLTNIAAKPISATAIRQLIKDKKDASSLVPKAVWEYINHHKIYQEK